jgi:hypothetical protein
MEVTITMQKVPTGTELTILQAGVPDIIPADACYVGWQESLVPGAHATCVEDRAGYSMLLSSKPCPSTI